MVELEKSKTSHVINQVGFNLKLMGKTLCPASFVFLNGISHNKLSKLVQKHIKDKIPEEDNSSQFESDEAHNFEEQDRLVSNKRTTIEEEGISTLSSKSKIKVFLGFLHESDMYSEPMVGFPETHRRVSILPRPLFTSTTAPENMTVLKEISTIG